MKPVNSNQLKVGDWIVNQRTFTSLTKEGLIQGVYDICQIERIVLVEEGSRKGKEDIYVKCWNVIGDKVNRGGGLGDMDKIYLLEEGDLIDIKKQIMLKSLE